MINNELVKHEATNSAKSIIKTFEAQATNKISAKNIALTTAFSATPFLMTPAIWAIHPVLGFVSGVALFGASAIAWAGSSSSLSSKIESHEQAMHEMYMSGNYSEEAINTILSGQSLSLGKIDSFIGMFKSFTEKRRTTRHNLDWPSYAASLFRKQIGTSKTVYPNGGGFELTYVYKRFAIVSVELKFMNNAEDEWEKAYNQILGLERVEQKDAAVSVAKVLEAVKRVAKSLDM